VTEDIDGESKPSRSRPPSSMSTSADRQTPDEKPEQDPIIETLENAFYRFARYILWTLKHLTVVSLSQQVKNRKTCDVTAKVF